MTDFCYIEYGCPAEQMDQGDLVLRSIGFKMRSANSDRTARFYSQNRSVILLREWPAAPSMTMLGIGMLCDADSAAAPFKTQHDSVVDAEVVQIGGMRVTLLDEHAQLGRWRDCGFSLVDSNQAVNVGCKLDHFSGLLVEGSSDSIDAWSKLGFSFTREGDWSVTAMSKNRQFSLLLAKKPVDTTVIVDSKAIFDTVIMLALSKHYGIITNAQNKEQIAKVRKYECVHFSNSTYSFSVEKFYPNLLLGNHMIVRERQQYLHTLESSLEAHLTSYASHVETP